MIGGIPCADTRCVGGVFPGKVSRRGNLYYQLKDFVGPQHVPGMFMLVVPLRQGPALRCKAMDAGPTAHRENATSRRSPSSSLLGQGNLDQDSPQWCSVVLLLFGSLSSCDFVRSVLLKSRQSSCAVWYRTVAESTEKRRVTCAWRSVLFMTRQCYPVISVVGLDCDASTASIGAFSTSGTCTGMR